MTRYDESVPSKLPVVRGTMKIHQVAAQTPGKITHRELSCFCRRGEICQCHDPIVIDFNQSGNETIVEAIPTKQQALDLIGKFVLVIYDAQPFVGQVLQVVEDEIEVSCLRQTGGKNSFVWPETPDVIYYYRSEIQAIISEPEPYSNRSAQLCNQDWRRFNEMR